MASHPEQGWSLLGNGVVAFEDTGVLLPDGRSMTVVITTPGRETGVRTCRPGTGTKGSPMRQIRITKRQRPASWCLEPLPPGARDPDIVRTRQLARRARPTASRYTRGRRTGGTPGSHAGR